MSKKLYECFTYSQLSYEESPKDWLIDRLKDSDGKEMSCFPECLKNACVLMDDGVKISYLEWAEAKKPNESEGSKDAAI